MKARTPRKEENAGRDDKEEGDWGGGGVAWQKSKDSERRAGREVDVCLAGGE